MEEQTLEVEKLYNSLKEAEETSRSEIEAMRQKHEVQISDSTAEVRPLNFICLLILF